MMDLGGRQGPSGAAGGSKIRADFQFTPTRAQPASETPRTHPHGTPKDHHGTKGFFEFGVVEKLLRVLGASTQYLLSTWLAGVLALLYYSLGIVFYCLLLYCNICGLSHFYYLSLLSQSLTCHYRFHGFLHGLTSFHCISITFHF